MWFHNHPFIPIIAGALALVLVGLLIVSSRTAYNPTQYATTWGIPGGVFFPTQYTTRHNDASSFPQTAPFQYDTPIPSLSLLNENEDNQKEESSDVYALLLASIRPSSYPVLSTGDTSSLDAVYSFIPTGLRAVTEPKQLSDEKHALYEYGNEVGSYIDTYESTYGARAVSVLKEFYADRSSVEKQEAVRRLALAIRRVGEEMIAMEYVPKDLSGMHALLGERYQNAGETLANIPSSKNNDELLSRIAEYNAAADALTTAIITLATFFAVAEISFTSHEPGHVFTFSPSSGF